MYGLKSQGQSTDSEEDMHLSFSIVVAPINRGATPTNAMVATVSPSTDGFVTVGFVHRKSPQSIGGRLTVATRSLPSENQKSPFWCIMVECEPPTKSCDRA